MAGEPMTRFYEQFQPPERLTLLLEAMARDDADEVARLQRSCPRMTYTMQDAAFSERWEMAFDIMAVICIDLRCMWGKLHVLEWVIGSFRQIATGHQFTAGIAFVEGVRCGQGLPQTEFFARPLPPPDAVDESDPEDADYAAVDDEEEVEEDDDPDADRLDIRLDHGRRLDAVQTRSEHFTACGMVLLLGAVNDIAQDLVNSWAAFGRFCRTRVGVSPETMLRAWQFPADEFIEALKRYERVKPQAAKVDEYCGYISKQWDGRFRRRRDSEFVEYGDEVGDEDGGDGNGE